MAETEAPQISTLGPDDEDFVQRSSQSPKISTATPSGSGKFRFSKIKLRVPDRPPTPEERPQVDPGGGDEDEEDQLIDDDLGLSNNPPSSVTAAKAKRVRKPRAKSGNPFPPAEPPEIVPPNDEDVPQIPVAIEPEDVSIPSGERKTMVSAWQVQVPNVTPTPGGRSDVWDSHEPGKGAKRKPVRKAGTPSSQPKPKRAAPKKLDEIASVEGNFRLHRVHIRGKS